MDEAGQVFADIAEVPGFARDAGDFFLALRIAQNKAVFVGVGSQPAGGFWIKCAVAEAGLAFLGKAG